MPDPAALGAAAVTGACVLGAAAVVVAVLRSSRPLVDARELSRIDLIRQAAATLEPLAVDGAHRLWAIGLDRDWCLLLCGCGWVGREYTHLDFQPDVAIAEWRPHVDAYVTTIEGGPLWRQM